MTQTNQNKDKEKQIDLLCSIYHELRYTGHDSERVQMIFENKFTELGLGDFEEAFERWGNET